MHTEDQQKKPPGTMSRIGTVLHVLWKHKQYGLWVLWIVLAPLFYLFTRACLLLDVVFFPALRKIQIDKPVFIMGHPRSGTTFFQKEVYKSGQVTMFSTWEMALPSLVQRKLFSPVIWILERLNLDVLQSARKGHEIRLQAVEEDEGLFLHRLDTEMLTVFAPWLLIDDEYGDLGFKLGWNDARENRRSLIFFRECLKRQILYTGKKQIVAKCNPSIFRLETILEVFPDAQIVYMVRSPQNTMRSFLSFTSQFVSPLLTEPERNAYFRKKYQWSVQLYRYFEEIKASIPEDQLMVILFHELTGDLPRVMARFFRFAGITPDERYWEQLYHGEGHSKQKKHTNSSLKQFGISNESIRADLGFIWDRYLEDGEGPKFPKAGQEAEPKKSAPDTGNQPDVPSGSPQG